MTEWPTKPPIGQGLLGTELAKDRGQTLVVVGAAYRSILDEKRRNFGLWHVAMDHVESTLQERYTRLGLTAAPFQLHALWSRVALLSPASDPNAHLRLIRALMTPFDHDLADHILYRMRTGGNVHFEFSGPTGMGKSSCAVALADWIKPIQYLEEHLSFDLGDLPQKLKGKTAGQTVIQDECLAMAGEGSRTIHGIFENIEDTLRASQVNLFTVSPTHKEHNTTQAELELILWNPEKRFSVFLAWINGQPHGVVALPWMREDLWMQYKPWKARNVERSLGGQFRDNAFLARTTLRLFADDRFVGFLMAANNKPKKPDFQGAIALFHPQMLAGTQQESLVNFIQTVCYAFDRLEREFLSWFGVEPNEGLRRVALKCYKDA